MRQTKKEILKGINLTEIKKSKIVDNNTLEIEYVNGDRAIRLHNTNVVIYKVNGDIVLTSGGWQTLTTKDRLNKYTPFNIMQKKGIWYINDNIIFYDNIILNKQGKVKSEVKKIDMKKLNKTKHEIKRYTNLIDKLNELPKPSNGDCWYCLFKTQEDKSWGDTTGNIDHLQQHIKEGYIFGAILYNAMIERGYRPEQVYFHYELNIKDTFKRALRKYLYKRLLKTV